jgi:PAS domain S-box-containing protein
MSYATPNSHKSKKQLIVELEQLQAQNITLQQQVKTLSEQVEAWKASALQQDVGDRVWAVGEGAQLNLLPSAACPPPSLQPMPALQKSEHRFRAIVEQAPFPIQIYAADGSPVFMNPAWKQMWCTKGNALDSSHPQCDSQVEALGLTPELKRAFAGEIVTLEPVLYNATHPQHPSKPRWIATILYPIQDESGVVLEVVAVNRDVTRRKQAEAALRQSEERLSLALDASSMGIWDWDLLTNCITWSESHEQLFGLEPGSFDGTDAAFKACLHPQDREAFKEAVNHAIQQRTSFHHEYRIIWPDGSLHWIEAKGRAFYNEAGQPVRMTGTVIDICDRKLAEAALRTAKQELELRVYQRTTELSLVNERLRQEQAALRESEARFRNAFEYASIGIALVGLDGYWRKVNPVLCEILGYGEQELLERTCYSITHPDDLAIDLNYVQQLLKGEIRSYEMEKRYIHKLGHEVWALLSVSLMRDTQYQPLYFIVQIQDISDRKTAAEKLKKSEANLAAAQRVAHVGSWEYDILTGNITWSEEKFRIFGLDSTQNAPTFSEFMKRIHPDDQGLLQRYIDRAITDGQPYELDFRILRADGAIRYLNCRGEPIFNAQGQVIQLFGVVMDITERKQVEEEYAKLIDILEATPDFISSSNLDGQVLYFNQAARNIMGLDSGNLENFDIPKGHPEWAAKIVHNEGIPTALREGSWLGETAMLSHDGREIPLSQLIIAHKSADGQVTQLSTIARDITQQKQAEATLREAERRWRYLLENVRLVVVGLDSQGKVEFANAFFLELTGYTQSEVLGKNWFEKFLPPAQTQLVQGVFQQVIHQEFHPHYTNAILTKSGEERLIAWNNTPLKNVQGEVIGTMSIGEDITERCLVEKMKNEFISIVSHELRTPLTSIRGSLGLLATGALNNHPQRMQRMIEIAAIDTERLVRLVNDILDLERLESGHITLIKSWCQVNALMEQSAEAMYPLAQSQTIRISVVPVSTQVWASPDHIIQTLTNLISNAIKFSPPHSTITLTAAPQGRYVLFQVQDQGRGIPADKLETIFGRFQQVDASDSRQKGGTGLGLAICRSIIAQHGGKIWVESLVGQGSTFYFTLPSSSES